jgi:hypothetical protein
VNNGWGSSEVGAQGKGNVRVIDTVFNVVDIGTLRARVCLTVHGVDQIISEAITTTAW